MSTESIGARARRLAVELEDKPPLTPEERAAAPARFARAVEQRRKLLAGRRAAPPLLPGWAACPPPRLHMVDEE